MKERSWEYEGRTVDEATQIALEELGLDRDDVFIEVIEEPQKGFLGIGGKGARIRVELIGEWEVLGKKEEEQAQVREIEEEVSEEQPVRLEAEPRIVRSTEKPIAMINKILEIFDIEALVEGKEKEEAIIIDIWGEDVAILIGRGGNTMDALQYLMNVCCRRTGEVNKRIIVDIEGYRKRRKARLEKQAEQTANKALSQGKSIEMSPMSAPERKIVHMALRKIDGVYSESVGEGPDRRVVIHLGEERST